MPREKTQQEIVQEQLEANARRAAAAAKAGSAATQQAILATWKGAQTTAERLVLVGGVLGILSFFLPWMSISFFFASAGGSGWQLARSGMSVLWLFPVTMALCLFLAWLNLHSDGKKRILVARWYIALGAAWGWLFVANFLTVNGSLLVGGFLVTAASFTVLVGGILQVRDQLGSGA